MHNFSSYKTPYKVSPKYKQPVAYFSMEFGIDQAFKIFSGGLGFLAGSHMRSAYQIKQNLIGIGILWSYGYYDQIRQGDQHMTSLFLERNYNFLQDTGILLDFKVNKHTVYAKALYLDPEVFGTAPMFFLTTDIPENDYLARSISNRLYDSNAKAKIAQGILLGKAGAILLQHIGWGQATYHLNEAHALPAAFHLYEKYQNLDQVKKQVVLTTHTPVEAGNEKHDINLLHDMSFFGQMKLDQVKLVTKIDGQTFNHTLAALRLSRKANGVSKIHGDVARKMWYSHNNVAEITHITNSQNHTYWHDKRLDKALKSKNEKAWLKRKLELKKVAFEIVADQTGKIFDPKVLTIVWARRFAAYKRPALITKNIEAFDLLVKNNELPIQIIWSGKPYPQDFGAIEIWNQLVDLAKNYPNLAVLSGYELTLSKVLKGASDIWLNNPRIPREASGTSGMTAAMLGSVNLSTSDGWIPEYIENGINGYAIPKVDLGLSQNEQDEFDRNNIMTLLQNNIIPMYYQNHRKWLSIAKESQSGIIPKFDSNRMADQYYTQLYSIKTKETINI